MKCFWIYFSLILYSLINCTTSSVVVDGDCSFQVNGDLNDPAPLFAPHNVYQLIVPDPSDYIVLENGAYLDMYCTDSFAAPFLGLQKITVQCLQHQYLLVNGTIYPFGNFSCLDWPKFSARRTGRDCLGGTDLVEVGFEVDNGQGFLQTYDVCHDAVNEVTPYVHHVLYPSSNDHQHGVVRPNFITLDFYGGRDVNNKYTQKQQNITISNILGMDATPYFNFSAGLILARGHMAAKADMIFGAAQRSTFLFINVAPQWQSFNGGNWERIESGVRKFVSDHELTVDCYTGTWAISSLPDVNGVPQLLYLDFDENNNGLIPVPKIYFRVVIDRDSRRGIVLIGVNNPYATLEEIQQDYIICTDIGARITWLDWLKEDLHEGYSYACSVPDFLQVVKELPLADLHTTGILGIEDDVDQCQFSVLGGQIREPAPLLTKAGVPIWLESRSNGVLGLVANAEIDMHCPNGFLMPFQDSKTVSAQCLGDKIFTVGDQYYHLNSFSCRFSMEPLSQTRRTGRICNGGTEIVEIGFEISTGFLEVLTVCHNEIEQRTPYVKHELTPGNVAYQYGRLPQDFQRDDFFSGQNLTHLYSQTQQNETFSEILGYNAEDYFNTRSELYLTYGQLAGNLNFVFMTQQRASLHYINTAPLWTSVLLGNWWQIDDGVRRFVANNLLNTEVYTGTWGVATLPDINGNERELYLDTRDLIPVPRLFYRILIDKVTRRGIVLIVVNNPHLTLEEALNDYVICNDIGDQINWIKWDKLNVYNGFAYACSVADFIAVNKDLPLEDLTTTGILGI